MLSINSVANFIRKIYYANGRKFDENFLDMWTREIMATGVTKEGLDKAEIRIIREKVPLFVAEVCDVIRDCKDVLVLPPKTECMYCEGKGYVLGLKFNKKGIYTGYEYILNCVCGNAHFIDIQQMKEDLSTKHKTECKDGYYRIFPSIKDKFEYLDKLKKNGWMDIKK